MASAIARSVTKPWTIMEVCGGQTHTIVKYGIDRVLPPQIEMVHGPGCPVCVTSLEMIDRAHAIASRPDVIFCSFGDMLRVPGSRGDLLQVKSPRGDVRVVYSPLDAVNLAAAHPHRKVVFFAIGFETTAPPNAMAVWMARKRRLMNFGVLVSHVLVPPMITAILQAPGNRVQAFLGPGHVCTVMACGEYEPIARRYRVPIVITGSIALSILELAGEESEGRHGRVVAVHLRLGRFSGVVKEALASAFELARKGTQLAQADLMIEEVPLLIHCCACAADQTPDSAIELRCPACGGLTNEIVSGRELEVHALEIEL